MNADLVETSHCEGVYIFRIVTVKDTLKRTSELYYAVLYYYTCYSIYILLAQVNVPCAQTVTEQFRRECTNSVDIPETKIVTQQFHGGHMNRQTHLS
jgi:hypothetical protein